MEAHLRQHTYSMRGHIEAGANDVRPCELELPPKCMLRPALMFGNRREHQQDRAVGGASHPPNDSHHCVALR
jgi:hypothetical protein